MRREEFYRRGTMFLVALQFMQTTMLSYALSLPDLPGPTTRHGSEAGDVSWISLAPQFNQDPRDAIPSILKRLVPGEDPNVAMKRGPRQTIDLREGGLDLTVVTLDVEAPVPDAPDPFARPQAPVPLAPKPPTRGRSSARARRPPRPSRLGSRRGRGTGATASSR